MTPTTAVHVRGILDTSVVIDLPRLLPTALPSEPLITAVTLAELSVGPLVATDERERAARQAHLQEAEAAFVPLPFDAPAARAFGRVAACLRQSGRKPRARSYDAMMPPSRSPMTCRYTRATLMISSTWTAWPW